MSVNAGVNGSVKGTNYTNNGTQDLDAEKARADLLRAEAEHTKV